MTLNSRATVILMLCLCSGKESTAGIRDIMQKGEIDLPGQEFALRSLENVMKSKNAVIVSLGQLEERKIATKLMHISRIMHKTTIFLEPSGKNYTGIDGFLSLIQKSVDALMHKLLPTDIMLISTKRNDEFILEFLREVARRYLKRHLRFVIFYRTDGLEIVREMEPYVFEELNLMLLLQHKSRETRQWQISCHMVRVNLQSVAGFKYLGRLTQSGETCENVGLLHSPAERYKTFKGRELKVIALKAIEDVMLHGYQRNTTEFQRQLAGLDREHVKILAKALDFRYRYANFSASGTGQVVAVYNREADFVPKVHMHTTRISYVEFVFSHFVDNFLLLSQALGEMPRTTILIRPLEPETWISILLAIVILGLVFSLFILQPMDENRQPVNNTGKCWWFMVHDLPAGFWHSFTIVIEQGSLKKTTSTGTWLTILWAWSAMIVAFSYNGLLYSHLTTPQLEKPVETLLELEHGIIHNGWTFGTSKGSAFEAVFKHAKGGVCKRLWQLAEPHWDVWKTHLPDTFARLDRDRRYMVVLSQVVVTPQYMKYRAHKYRTMKEFVQTMLICTGVRHGCPYKEVLDRVNQRLVHSGIVDHLLEMVVVPEFYVAKPKDVSLTLDHLQGSFFIISAGWIIAFVGFVLELIYYHRTKKQHRNCSKLKIISLENPRLIHVKPREHYKRKAEM